ncbi:MAG: tryptophan synthase subunit beta [Myxococcota bacterium]
MSPLYHARRLSELSGGAAIWLKREDLNHLRAQDQQRAASAKVCSRATWARRASSPRPAPKPSTASRPATVAALFGMTCHVFMGADDIERQKQSFVFRMRLLGAEGAPVTSGSRTLKDAMNEAMRDWVRHVGDTFYIIGSAAGPHPYPTMVRDFQAIIGQEARAQSLERIGRLPDEVVACVGGGSNAIGIFHPFLGDLGVALTGVEAAGSGLASGKHAATLGAGQVGVLHGAKSYLLQDGDGQIIETHSISAGLDYPGVGPEHAWLKDTGRVGYVAATDDEALDAFEKLCRYEGIIPALESSHAVAYAMRRAAELERDQAIVVNLSGRGDKDMHTVAKARHLEL